MSEPYDKIVDQVQKRLFSIYRMAKGGIFKSVDELIEQITPKVEAIQDEDLSKKDEKSKLLAAFLAVGNKKVKAVVDNLYEVNKTAKETINSAVPHAFSESMNHESYGIERIVGDDIGLFPVSDDDAAELLDDVPEIYETEDLNERKDKAWNAKNVRNAVVTGILVGATGKKLKQYVTNTVTGKNRDSMRNNAYTTISGAGESGKLFSMQTAETKGVEMEKLWTATLDFKTRDEHRSLDGVRVPLDEPFMEGLRFPRDPEAPAHLRCNCRCTMTEVYKGWKDNGKRRENIRHYNADGSWYKPMIDSMTYDEWYQTKVEELGEVEIKRQVNEMKREQQRKYYRKRKREQKKLKEGA